MRKSSRKNKMSTAKLGLVIQLGLTPLQWRDQLVRVALNGK